jgi:hypothetical protein
MNHNQDQESYRVGKFLGLMGDHVSNRITKRLLELNFFNFPSSGRHGGAYSGGLFDHSYSTTQHLLNYTEKLGLIWQLPRSPYIIGMFHGLYKLEVFKKLPGLPVYEPLQIPCNWDPGARSVLILSELITDLTEEEKACVEFHQGFQEDQLSYISAVMRHHNVLWAHTASSIVSVVEGL